MKIRKCCYKKDEKGEAMLITTILLLVLVIIVGTTMNVSGMQWDMAYMQKNTSNTYYLAKSGVEKGVDVINKAIQAQMPTILEEARKTYLTKVTDRDAVRAIANQSESSFYTDDSLKYQSVEEKIIIDKGRLSNFIKEEIYTFLKTSFFQNSDSKIAYEVKGDGQTEVGLTTLVGINFIIKPGVDTEVINFENFIIRCEAQVGGESNPKDTKVVEATLTIDIPNEISNEIHEAYNWLYNPAEIVDSAITCFSDVVVTGGAQLTVKGDMRISGTTKETEVDEATGKIDAPEMDEFGGVVVSNGGKLKVEAPFEMGSPIISGARSSYSRESNVIVSNKKSFLASGVAGSTEDNHTSNTGNIYCVSNVATTNGWALDPDNPSNTLQDNYNMQTSIEVEGDIMANTLSIYDDFYYGGKNQSPFNWMRAIANNIIDVKGNVFVDNDVRIDEYVKQSTITVEGSIFGISDGTIGPKLAISKDPNLSSGVFNRGNDVEGDKAEILADGIFVNGQPFISFGSGYFHALWESIGEPFKNVSSFSGYQKDDTPTEGDKSYLYASSPLFTEIKTNQIQIGTEEKVYVPDGTYISANGESKEYNDSIFGAKTEALKFFYKGDSDKSIKDLTKKETDKKYDSIQNLFSNSNEYYAAGYAAHDTKQLYYKNYIRKDVDDEEDREDKDKTENYKGIRGYMTSKRSVFYGSFYLNGNERENEKPKLRMLSFDKCIDSALVTSHSWTYETPIEVFDQEIEHTVSIDDYYIEGEDGSKPYPTIIINNSS
ncbi:MAG: hypothetical protein K0R69_3065, partial [Clostridia bacterium]|nr:hypothetical protein [Clostridia bacterium]